MHHVSVLSTSKLGGVSIVPRAPSGRHPAKQHCALRSLRLHAAAVAEPLADPTVEEYNRRMAEKMGWTSLDNPFEYRPERGLYYHYISEDVIVGSQPRSADDISHLANENNVRAILNLQQDKDLHHWGVNLGELQHAAHQHGVELIRTPAVDFDPHSLRATLPTAVAALERARRQHGRVYVHCTAGLGRSPAVAIAALYWFTDMDLDTAYMYLTGIRPCGPNKDAIRGATYDLLTGGHWDSFQSLPHHAFSSISDDEREVIKEKLLPEYSSGSSGSESE